MITVCVLNCHRSYFLTELFLPTIAHNDLVDEIIVSHGNERHLFEYSSDACRVVHRHDYGEVNDRFGLARRWLCWEMARNETILSIDEDIFLPPSGLDALHERYARDADVIHTLYGRCLTERFVYSDTTAYGEVPIAGTGCSILKRALGRACLDSMHLVEDFVRARSEPLWNGEDIWTSLVNIRLSGRMNRAHRLAVRDLDMWGRPGISRTNVEHQVYRSDLSRYAINKLGLRRTMRAAEQARRGIDEGGDGSASGFGDAVGEKTSGGEAQPRKRVAILPTPPATKSATVESEAGSATQPETLPATQAAEQARRGIDEGGDGSAGGFGGAVSEGTSGGETQPRKRSAVLPATRLPRHILRRATDTASWWRTKACMRPRFFIFGAEVVDTSTLFACLAKHPGVLMPSAAVHGYHVTHYDMGEHSYLRRKEPKYLRHFPLRRPHFRRRGWATGEHCAAYFYMPEACHRMCINLALAVHDWRCVVVLRDPVERALMRFCRRRANAERLRVWARLSAKSPATTVMENPDSADLEVARRCGQMPRDEAAASPQFDAGRDDAPFDEARFNEAMEKELWCLENGLSPLLSGMASAQLRRLFFRDDAQDFKFDDYNACTGGGVYAYWLDYLWRRVNVERVMVVRADELYGAFDETYARICDFLDLEQTRVAPPLPAALPTVSASTRERWMGFFDERSQAVFKRSKNRDALTRCLG